MFLRLVLLIALLGFFPGLISPAQGGEVVVVPLKGEVSKAQFIFLRRALKEAGRDGAEAVIIDMDTPGGGLETAKKMMDALFASSVPTITYVDPNAGSAGALIALSTQKIYMAPVSAIGAAAPILSTGGDIPETLNDKIVSYYSKYFRSAAEKYGYNPDIAEAFINKEKEVKVGDKVLSEKGSILTLSAQEAVMKENGKPILASGIADSVEEVAKMENLKGNLRRIEPAGFELLAFWLTTLSPLFLLGGIVGAYIEIKTPGFGLPGAVAVLCFLVFFAGHLLAGLAGYEVIAVFVLGLILVVVELVFFPGVVIVAVLGAALMLVSLLWTMVDRYPNQPIWPSPEMLVVPVLNLLIAGVLGFFAVLALARLLPKTPFYSHLVLAAASAPGTVGIPGDVVATEQRGVALTDLHPTGKVEIDGRFLDVVTQGEFIARNTPVRIISRDGMRTIVEAV